MAAPVRETFADGPASANGLGTKDDRVQVIEVRRVPAPRGPANRGPDRWTLPGLLARRLHRRP